MDPEKPLTKPHFPGRDTEKYPNPEDEPPDVNEDRFNSVKPHFPDASSRYYAELSDRLETSTKEGRADYQIADIFTCLSILANRDGFRFLAGKLMEASEMPPGEESWLPVEPNGMEMGRKVFILKMAGEKPPEIQSTPEESHEEQLKRSRLDLKANAKKSLRLPSSEPRDSDSI